MREWYQGWWSRPKRMTRKQMQEMINNMKKTDIIHEKSKKYHKAEEIEADDILKKLDENYWNSDFTN